MTTLVEIGVTDLLKFGGAMASPAPTALVLYRQASSDVASFYYFFSLLFASFKVFKRKVRPNR